MNELVVLVDAMGGDHAPDEIVRGCIEAVHEMNGFDIVLIGDSKKINNTLENKKYDKSRISIHHTSEVITNDDIPTKAIKNKKDSSMVVGFNLLKEKKGDVFLSAGNTGALMTGAFLILGRLKGVDRPPLAAMIPTRKGASLLIDVGANTMCKPINYAQFGVMGSIYMEEVFKIKNPNVGLINVGSEDKKGNETIKQAYTLLSNSKINFIGNIEGREIPDGNVNVLVCDGFTGNILLKFTEGVGSLIFEKIKEAFKLSIYTKIIGLASKSIFKNLKKLFDYAEYGCVPLLGVNGRVFKSHGSSNNKAIKNAVLKAYTFANSKVLERIEDEFRNMEVEEIVE